MIQYAIAWHPHSTNLGDDLRALAAMELMPRIDRVLDENRLDAPLDGLTDSDRVVALLTGNVLRETSHWLPEKHIAPVCAGLHVSREDVWGIPFGEMRGTGQRYLRACGPIGCRDDRTMALMEEADVPHALTACVTLTLKRPAVRAARTVCCVDAPAEVVQTLRNYAAGNEVLEMSHQMEAPSQDFHTRMENVRKVLQTYASARFVVTRRLHCAMACLAIGTPVVLLYNSDYEDVNRFAPMDGMVRTMPVEVFLGQLHQNGMPESWVNPMGVEAWQEKIAAFVADGIARAETMALPIVPQEEAQAWRTMRLRQVAVSSAEKIHRLEQQQLSFLHEKFAFILREDSAKAMLSGMLEEPEVRRALSKAARRKLLKEHVWYKRPQAWVWMKQGKLAPEDWYTQAMEQLSQLGWPEE